jgi:hypothetical protein
MKYSVLAIALLTALPVVADDEVRTIRETFEVGAEHEIRLEVPIGEVYVSPGSTGQVEIELIVSCGSSSTRCRERAEEIYLDSDLRRRSLALEVRGISQKLTRRPSVDVRLKMPATSALQIDLGVGELEIEDLTGDLEADVGVGEVDVFVAEEAVGTIRLAVGVGEANLHPRRRGQSDSGFLFLGNELEWDDGPGSAYLVIDVGVGEVNVIVD